MPRASNGDYTLPAGNPVVTGTVIASTWANNTLSDLATAMTDSLSRSGDGAMLAALELTDGLVGAPGLTWGTDTTSGLYRAGAADYRFSVTSNFVAQFAAGAFRVVDGSAGTPSISFISDTDTGIFRNGANDMRLVAGGVAGLSITATAVSPLIAFLFADGTVGAPSIAFSSDTDTGLYRIGANSLGVSAGGSLSLTVENALVQSEKIHRFVDGTAGAPGITFSSDANSGFYRIGADNIGVTANGGLVFDWSASAATSAIVVRIPNGSVGTPALAFSGDTDTGFYTGGANTIAVAAGGTFSGGWGAGQSIAPDGSASAPAYSFNSDTNTGIYRIGADQLGFTENGTGYRIGYRGVPAFGQNAGYTFVANDVGQQTTANSAGTFTVPPSVFAAGDVFTFINTTGSNCTLAQGAGVTLRLLGTAATTGNRTVASFGMATIIAQNSTVFLVCGPGVS